MSNARLSSVIAISLLCVCPLVVQGQEVPRTIIGLPMQAVEHIPGMRTLFEIPSASEPPRILEEPFRQGELVARFRLELSDDDVLAIARRAGAHRVVRKSPIGLFFIECGMSYEATERVMARLWETGDVVMISPNYTGGGLSFVPNDPHHTSGAQWYHHQDPSDIDLDLPEAWDIERGSESVVVAVMDTGIKVDHPEFEGRLWENLLEKNGEAGEDDDNNGYVDDINGWNATEGTGGPEPGGGNGNIDDPNVGHGTYVSSVLMANADNDHQIAGFDHNAKLLTVRALSEEVGTNAVHLHAGFDYLILMSEHYDILNMSWSRTILSSLRAKLDQLALTDVIMIAGSGNSALNADQFIPGGHSAVITVSGTDSDDHLADFSNTGSSVEFSAPAVDIYLASWSDRFNEDAFHVANGTSYSGPMVAGIASLGLATRPGMTEKELIFALKASAEDLDPPGWDPQFGWGRVNAHGALAVLESMIFLDDFETGDVSRWSSSSP